MLIELPGVASRFDDLEPGSFFAFQQTQREFGLCVWVDGTKCAVIFSYSEKCRAPLWLAVGGLPRELISLPLAILRPNLSSVGFDGKYDAGAIISSEGEVYIQAKETISNHFTFNVSTGHAARLKLQAPTITFAKWQVGILIGDQFDPIFQFPSANPPLGA